MADNHTPEVRSYNMSQIRSKDTKPEIWLRKQLYKKGFRYRKNVKYIPGKPDLFLRKYNTAIFVNGCFWHRHAGCKYAYIPKSRVDYWNKKFVANVTRDLENQKVLLEMGIKCLVVWECSIRSVRKEDNNTERMINEIIGFLSSESMYLEI